MSGFHDVRLPSVLALGATGGPQAPAEVIRLASGREVRVARFSAGRRRWEIGGGTMPIEAAEALAAFFEARRGPVHAFRFRDPFDARSAPPGGTVSAFDQPLGTGDGTRRVFPLVKRYGSGEDAVVRRIRKPVAGSVRAGVDGVETTAFAVDAASGEVVFDAPPPPGAALTAGFEFDLAVRFAEDRIEMTLEAPGAVRIARAGLVEVDA